MKINLEDMNEEEIEKLLRAAKGWIEKDEMPAFGKIQEEYPSLKKHSKTVLEQLLTHYRLIVDLVFKAHGGTLYSHSLVVNGAILRSLNFYRGAIWALATRNPHVLYDSLRAQCETLALIAYCNRHPSYVVPATVGERDHKDERLRIRSVSTLMKEANKKYKRLWEDYSSLCEYVHPNPASLYANIQPKTETKKGSLLIAVGTRSPRVTEEDAEKSLRILVVWTSWIFNELTELAEYFKKTVKE
jgi:hypothetical protein